MEKVKKKISIEFEVEYDQVPWKGGFVPKTLYKYRNWEDENHQKILKNGAIWVSDSYNLNDPFDCNIPVNYDELQDDNIAREYLKKLLEKNKVNLGRPIDEQVELDLKKGIHKNLDTLQSLTHHMRKSIKDMLGIFSATPINDNILMWSHYANSHKGFCVGFNSVDLFDTVAGGGGVVNYSSTYPIISPLEDRDKQYGMLHHTKSNHWEYEVEYRLTTFGRLNMEVKIPLTIITEVIFGACMPVEHKEEIKHILKMYYPHIMCYTCTQDSKDFKINLIQENI